MFGQVEFVYNGTLRTVNVHKETADYIQGENVHTDAEIRFATYSKTKMQKFTRLSGPMIVTPNIVDLVR